MDQSMLIQSAASIESGKVFHEELFKMQIKSNLVDPEDAQVQLSSLWCVCCSHVCVWMCWLPRKAGRIYVIRKILSS